MRRLWPLLAVLAAIPLCAPAYLTAPRVETQRLAETFRVPPDGTALRVGPPILLDPSAIVLSAALPPLPKEAPTSVGPLPVERVMQPCGSGDNFGCFDSVHWVIQVRDSMPAVVAWITLEHEVQHAAFFVSGLKFDDRAVEDKVADVVAMQQVLELRAGWPKP